MFANASGRHDPILKVARGPLESVRRLLENPTDGAGSVVAILQIMVKRGKAVPLAFHLHACKLMAVKIWVSGDSPILCGSIHREARSQRSVGANNQ
jgi:hypothetical protein